MGMWRRGTIGVTTVVVVALVAGAILASSGWLGNRDDRDDREEPLAMRLQSLLAYQDDGYHILLAPGSRSLSRVVEAAQAMSMLDQLSAEHLQQTARELRSSWDPQLGAYATDDGLDAYEDDGAGREMYQYDLLSLNVRVTEFLHEADAFPAARALPQPDLLPFIEQLDGSWSMSARIMRARAARFAGYRTAAEQSGSCAQIAGHLRDSRVDMAADLALTLPSTLACVAEVEPLLTEIAELEDRIAAQIQESGVYAYDDVQDLDSLRILAEAGGRAGGSVSSARVARLLLRALDEDARKYGPATEPWTIIALVRLLGEQRPPHMRYVVQRLGTLVDFRGSLATEGSADWFSRTMMAHLMVLARALSPDEAGELFGHPSEDSSGVGAADWTYAFVGLRSRQTADVTLPSSVLTSDADVFVRALYAADSASCPDAPDAAAFESVSPVALVGELPPGQRLSYVLALTLSAPCLASTASMLVALTDRIGLPDRPPDLGVRGSLWDFLQEVEAVCLVHGTARLDHALVSSLGSYVRALSSGPVRRNFDLLDLYAALRLLSLHESESCGGAWWDGLTRG